MKKIVIVSTLMASSIGSILAEDNKLHRDTIKTRYLDEIIISSSTKETNDLKSYPASVSYITPQMIAGQKITSVKGLSSVIPNFFVADYGSKLSTPIYIRGIGERSTGQSIGMYVDNMPYMDKTIFDFDFVDVQRVEVLRGPQGTLYGRNAMSGIVNVFTQSALQPSYSKVTITGGNYGLWRGKAVASFLIRENLGISLNLYGNRHDGYFTNQHTGEKADELRSAGGRARIDWKINPHWMFIYTLNFDSCRQGAFPYGEYVNGKIASPSYNYPGSYNRKTWTHNLNLNYRNESVVFNSSTGFLQFGDNMKMDTDYGVTDMFRLNQLQKEKSWTEELTLKSNTSDNYQWSVGAFGFYNDLKTNVITTMGKAGIENILQPVFDNIPPMKFEVLNNEIPIPGVFQTPAHGLAFFHQSTYNDLFVENLSLTAGIRFDYEKTKLDYDTQMTMNLKVIPPYGKPQVVEITTRPDDFGSMSFTEWLPKVALKYNFDSNRFVYASAAKGYKAGGYNIQMFADVVRDIIEERGKNYRQIASDSIIPQEKPEAILEKVTYRPEHSWNYELGFKGDLIKDVFHTEIAVFYVDVNNILVTRFVESGQGRILKNAGKARSYGFDWGLSASFNNLLRANLNYGFTRAAFTDYETEGSDYKGKVIPFAPQNTLSLGLVYNKRYTNKLIDCFNIRAQYNAAGKIYWTEENDIYQNFYGILNTKIAVNKGVFELGVWTNNTLNTEYSAFSFKSSLTENERILSQKGRPFTLGIDASLRF